MKRTPLKRGVFKRKARKPLRNNTPARAAKNRKAAKVRREMVETIGACDLCERQESLCIHEIARGNRSAAFDKPFATLVLCDGCHKHLHAEPAIWTKAKQAALLKIRRPEAFDLPALNGLLIAKLDEDEIAIAVRSIQGPRWFDHSGRRTA